MRGFCQLGMEARYYDVSWTLLRWRDELVCWVRVAGGTLDTLLWGIWSGGWKNM